ncbi:hypothetical protein RIF29_21582 [Crotalaria pallida]|uniref:Proteasome assembly chaperone 4 n=1 Tax=Crotalaria pallida TaxID=3830 RepID=A0AAN9F7L8_CROPI
MNTLSLYSKAPSPLSHCFSLPLCFRPRRTTLKPTPPYPAPHPCCRILVRIRVLASISPPNPNLLRLFTSAQLLGGNSFLWKLIPKLCVIFLQHNTTQHGYKEHTSKTVYRTRPILPSEAVRMDSEGMKQIQELKLTEKEKEESELKVTCFSEVVNEGSIHFQIIRFPKQIYVWIGYNSAKLGHMYAAAHTRPNNNVSATNLLGGTIENTGSGIARRLVLKTGLNVILACNLPKNSSLLEIEAEKILVQKLISLGYTKPRSEATSM